ncbi:hypothetical protein C8R44DRAFT_159957 [Mycena epipterygia]|nr:hypothetical protein C8R44DRAFT_159957 [Mycena epipterygia]
MEPPLAMLPFCGSDDFGYEINSTLAPNRDLWKTLRSHPQYYLNFLYSNVLDATARQENSLRDLPVEIISKILTMAILESRSTGIILALASPWLSDISLAARLAHVSLRTSRQLDSFHGFIRSSSRAAAAVRTLWISDYVGKTATESLIPNILSACPNLQALGCHLAPLDVLCRAKEPFPVWLLSVQITLTEFMGMPWQSPLTKWTRLLRTAHGATFLQNLTHLRLVSHHYLFDQSFPAHHLPRLTHLAMGSEKMWSRHPNKYSAHIHNFAHSIEHLWKLTSLKLAVLVFRVYSRHYYRPQPPQMWQARELVQAARDCRSGILIYCILHPSFRESNFWDECATNGEDIWSLAQKQTMLLMSEV